MKEIGKNIIFNARKNIKNTHLNLTRIPRFQSYKQHRKNFLYMDHWLCNSLSSKGFLHWDTINYIILIYKWRLKFFKKPFVELPVFNSKFFVYGKRRPSLCISEIKTKEYAFLLVRCTPKNLFSLSYLTYLGHLTWLDIITMFIIFF